MNKGKIVQVMGPVVDVEFSQQPLPHIKDALTVENGGKRLVMEVAQHIGGVWYDVSCFQPVRGCAEIWK